MQRCVSRLSPGGGRLALGADQLSDSRGVVQIEVEFKIRGEHALYGDGMALWLTKTRAQQGPVFGSADKFDGLGIFIDTYKNNRPGVVFPYVMAMVGDGQTAYDKENDGKANELAGCSVCLIITSSFPQSHTRQHVGGC